MSKGVTVQSSPVPRGTERAQAAAARVLGPGAWRFVPGAEADETCLPDACERFGIAEHKNVRLPLSR